MASIKAKFSLGQQVSAIKSGKGGIVSGIYVSSKGVGYDVQTSGKRPWRFAESALQTQAQADKAQAARAKAAKAKAKPAVVKAEAPAKAVKAPKLAKKKTSAK